MLSENGKINRLSGWKHTKTFQVYVYIGIAIMCLLLFFHSPSLFLRYMSSVSLEKKVMNKFPSIVNMNIEKRKIFHSRGFNIETLSFLFNFFSLGTEKWKENFSFRFGKLPWLKKFSRERKIKEEYNILFSKLSVES